MIIRVDGTTVTTNVNVGDYVTHAVNADIAQLATSASIADSASYAVTAETVVGSVESASYAVSSSYASVATTLLGSVNSASYSSVAGRGNTFASTVVDFDVASPPAYREGRLFYDADVDTLAYFNESANVTLNIGQETYLKVRNSSGGQITNGTPVYINGVQGQTPTIAPAVSVADDSQYNPPVGITTETIANNATGYVTCVGTVNNLNTSAYADGDVLYLQTGSAGLLTPLQPQVPYKIVAMAIVLNTHNNQGRLYVNPRAYVPSTIFSGSFTGSLNGAASVAKEARLMPMSGSFGRSFYSPLFNYSSNSVASGTFGQNNIRFYPFQAPMTGTGSIKTIGYNVISGSSISRTGSFGVYTNKSNDFYPEQLVFSQSIGISTSTFTGMAVTSPVYEAGRWYWFATHFNTSTTLPNVTLAAYTQSSVSNLLGISIATSDPVIYTGYISSSNWGSGSSYVPMLPSTITTNLSPDSGTVPIIVIQCN